MSGASGPAVMALRIGTRPQMRGESSWSFLSAQQPRDRIKSRHNSKPLPYVGLEHYGAFQKLTPICGHGWFSFVRDWSGSAGPREKTSNSMVGFQAERLIASNHLRKRWLPPDPKLSSHNRRQSLSLCCAKLALFRLSSFLSPTLSDLASSQAWLTQEEM